jgi:hypothetical protein
MGSLTVDVTVVVSHIVVSRVVGDGEDGAADAECNAERVAWDGREQDMRAAWDRWRNGSKKGTRSCNPAAEHRVSIA